MKKFLAIVLAVLVIVGLAVVGYSTCVTEEDNHDSTEEILDELYMVETYLRDTYGDDIYEDDMIILGVGVINERGTECFEYTFIRHLRDDGIAIIRYIDSMDAAVEHYIDTYM